MVTNNVVHDVFKHVNGKPQMVHKVLCELGGVTLHTIIVGSIYNKAKRVVHLVRKLKNCRNNERLQKYLQTDLLI